METLVLLRTAGVGAFFMKTSKSVRAYLPGPGEGVFGIFKAPLPRLERCETQLSHDILKIMSLGNV